MPSESLPSSRTIASECKSHEEVNIRQKTVKEGDEEGWKCHPGEGSGSAPLLEVPYLETKVTA